MGGASEGRMIERVIEARQVALRAVERAVEKGEIGREELAKFEAALDTDSAQLYVPLSPALRWVFEVWSDGPPAATVFGGLSVAVVDNYAANYTARLAWLDEAEIRESVARATILRFWRTLDRALIAEFRAQLDESMKKK